MKNWLNKLSVWQRIFIILSFGYLILVICLWYTEWKGSWERQMKETELLIERDQASIYKDRLVEIYELISGYDSEGKHYEKGTEKLSNLFEWLSSEGFVSEASILDYAPENVGDISFDDLKSARVVILHPDGSETLIGEDGLPMGVIEILKWTNKHDWGGWAELAVSRYKKDFDFSKIENRYKTRIHNHEQKSKELRHRHINVEQSVRCFLFWIVPVAVAYGLCLGIPKLNKLGGWHRIFLVYACTNFVIVVFICAVIPDIVLGSRYPRGEDVTGFILTYGIMPIGLVYGLGRSVGWALRGFGKDKDK